MAHGPDLRPPDARVTPGGWGMMDADPPERLRRLSPAEVAERDRDREALAEVLYRAWCAWELERTNVAHPRWFALREDLKGPYRFAARSILGKRVG